MLTAQLRELENDGLVSRTIFAEVPPKVEYAITDKACGLGPTMDALTAWWTIHGRTVPAKRSTGSGRKARE
jgi:DNA-binding HxlR family transcriptional regulator